LVPRPHASPLFPYTTLFRSGVHVDFQSSAIDGRFSSELESAVYRLVQEALSNVAHHAGVTGATLKVWSNDHEVCVEVEDHGIGLDRKSTRLNSSHRTTSYAV